MKESMTVFIFPYKSIPNNKWKQHDRIRISIFASPSDVIDMGNDTKDG